MSVFKNQSLLDIFSDLDVKASQATTIEILYEKPSGTSGAWTAELVNDKRIKYSVQQGDIDESGIWKIQSKVIIAGRTGYGKIASFNFEIPLE